MNKNRSIGYYLFICTIIVCLIIFSWLLDTIASPKNRHIDNKNMAEELIINTPRKSTEGTIKFKNTDGNTVYEYYGQIYINRDGFDGNSIEVTVECPF